MNFPRFLEVFVPWTILYNSYRNDFFEIVFTCSIACERYQTWYGNNYLNLINSQAGPKKKIKYTSRDVARLSAAVGFMVGDNNKTRQDLVELEASLAPAKADVGAEAKADQYNCI